MKLIKPYTELYPLHSIDTSEAEVLAQIEKIARTCYKSEDKIGITRCKSCNVATPESCTKPKYISGNCMGYIMDESILGIRSDIDLIHNKLIPNGHHAMLEFGYHPIVKVTPMMAESLGEIAVFNSESKDEYTTKYLNISRRKNDAILSGSFRVFRDIITNHSDMLVVRILHKVLEDKYPLLFADLHSEYMPTSVSNATLIDAKDLFPIERVYHVYLTVKFVCDRGVSHELVRHRVASFAQESTRYCNYGKDEHIKFIIPPWINVLEGNYDYTVSNTDSGFVWAKSMLDVEQYYNQLLAWGWTPQQARSVLPNSLKTEINVCANIHEWRHIFKLRTAKSAHPQMRELMCPLLDNFKSTIPLLFDDIRY